MSLHKEISFEDEICGYLAANDWFYVEGDALYDRARALFPSDLVAWVQATQPKAWDTLVKNHGAAAQSMLLDRIRKQLDDRGTLDVLRHGVELIGLRHPVALAQFKPAMAMNPDIMARYAANRLRIVRQVRYSSANENCIDLVLFLNGVPVATAELKTDFTQSVEDAIDQYRFDRHPRPKRQSAEPLLNFPSGAVVHFAVSNSEVHMTTQLAGPMTRMATRMPATKTESSPSIKPKPTSSLRKALANHEIVVLATYLAGGKSIYTDTEDIAYKANEIAPGRFAWRKYKEQINIETVRKRLWDATKSGKGGYLIGSERDGWLLTQTGLKFCRKHLALLTASSGSSTRRSQREQTWISRERARMLAETAYQKFAAGQMGTITSVEAERFFRVDDYVIGAARKTKIKRSIAAFATDPLLGEATKRVAELVRSK